MKNEKINFGLTTIETIVVICIFVLISLIIFGWQKDIFFINTLFSKRLTSQENIRKTIKNFVTEIREAQISAAGAYPLEKVNKDEIIFYSDIDLDGIVERVRYFLQDKKIKKGVIKPSGQPPVYNPDDEVIIELVSHIINPNNEIFTYFDKNYDGSGDPLPQPVEILAVRLVRITIVVDEDPNRPPEPITETSQATIRNLKDNL